MALKRIRAEIDRHFPGRMLLAEANQWPEDVLPYFGDGDECHMAFHFPLMPRMYMAIAQEDRHPMADILRQTPDIPPSCQWGIFLRNHDELTLEMVTNKERDYLWQVYAADRRARLNLGIRRRLAPLMDNDLRKIQLMNSLLLSMPGTPIVYYGDEIGMGDNIFLGDRDGVRTPMQWSPDRNGGFSRADPARLYLPPIMDPIYGFDAVNVEVAAARSVVPAQLDEADDHGPPGARGLRPWHPAPALSAQPQDPGLSARARRRQDPVRGQSRPRRPGGRARSQGVPGARARSRCWGAARFRRSATCLTCSPCPATASTGSCSPQEAELPRWHEPMPEPLPDFITLVMRDGWSTARSKARTRASSPARSCRRSWPTSAGSAPRISRSPARRSPPGPSWPSVESSYLLAEIEVQLAGGARAATLLPAACHQLRGPGPDPRLAAPVVLARPGSARRQGRGAVRRDGGPRLSAGRVRRDPSGRRAAELGRHDPVLVDLRREPDQGAGERRGQAAVRGTEQFLGGDRRTVWSSRLTASWRRGCNPRSRSAAF